MSTLQALLILPQGKVLSAREVRRNLRLLRLLHGLLAAELAAPAIALYFLENGLSQLQIYLLLAGRVSAALLLDVPTGYFADRFGRKRCLLMCAALITIALVVERMATSFWPILVAEIILGAGFSIGQGADCALAYDTHVNSGREAQYKKFVAGVHMYKAISGALAAVCGGIIVASGGLRLSVFAQVPIFMLLIVVTLFLKEPQRIQTERKKSALKKTITDNRTLKWLVLYSASTVVSLDIMTWMRQFYYKEVGIPAGWFGVLMTAYLAAVALSARLAGWYERLGFKRVFISFTATMVATFVVMATVRSNWVLLAMIGPAFVMGAGTTIIEARLNSLIISNRATVLSIEVAARRVCFLFTGPLLGLVIDLYSLSLALLATAGIFGLVGASALVGMLKVKRTRV